MNATDEVKRGLAAIRGLRQMTDSVTAVEKTGQTVSEAEMDGLIASINTAQQAPLVRRVTDDTANWGPKLMAWYNREHFDRQVAAHAELSGPIAALDAAAETVMTDWLGLNWPNILTKQRPTVGLNRGRILDGTFPAGVSSALRSSIGKIAVMKDACDDVLALFD